MLDPTLMSLYLAALAAIFLAPGPDMALVMATATARNARAGLRTALGIAAARFLHVLASGLGLAALLAAHPALHGAVRAIGAGYLLWLAWKALRSAPVKPDGAQSGLSHGEAPRPGGLLADMLRGFLTNLLNPKALLFCGLLLPQFASPERGPLLAQFAWLGVVLVAVGFAFDAAYALLAGGLARRLASTGAPGSRLERARTWLMGTVFAAMAARLALG